MAHLLVLLATALVAGSFVASAGLAGTISPFSLTALRFGLASAALLPWVLARGARRRAFVSALPRAGAISFFFAAFFACQFEALETTTALNTGALYTLVPFLTALLCLVLLRQPLTGRQLAVYLLGTVGTAWVVFRGDLDRLLGFELLPGDPLFLLGTVIMGLYGITLRQLSRPDDDRLSLVAGILLTGTFWMAVALAVSGDALGWERLGAGDAFAMTYLVVGATLLTVPLYQASTMALGPRRVMAYTYLTPGLVALLELVLHGTPVAPRVLPGLGLSVLATIWLQRED